MQSEVRKVLEKHPYYITGGVYEKLDAAERADAARREEPVIVSDVVAVDCARCGMHISTTDHAVRCNCGTVIVVHKHDLKVDTAGREALRQAVAELVARWRTCFLPTPVAEIVRDLLTELNAIIATKPDTVENRQATASGPVHDVTPADAPKESDRQYVTATGPVQNVASSEAKKTRNFGDVIRKKLQENPELAEQVADEHIRAIAEETVRDAMPDVLDEVANAIHGCGFTVGVNGLRKHAAKLRKERATWN